MIFGGFDDGGESSSAKKAHLRSIRIGETLEVQVVSKFPRLDTTITFSDSDLEGYQHPHDDPLVIRAIVANKTVHRVLIDNGSSVDISSHQHLTKWHRKGEAGTGKRPIIGILRRESATPGIGTACTHFRRPPMPGHNDDKIPHSGCPLAYNILLGRPSLNAIRVVPSAYHMVVKFLTENGVGMVRGDQWVAKECYLASMKQKAVYNIHMDELDMRDKLNTRPMPSEELEPVQLDDQPKHLTYIGSKLAEDVKDLLIRF